MVSKAVKILFLLFMIFKDKKYIIQTYLYIISFLKVKFNYNIFTLIQEHNLVFKVIKCHKLVFPGKIYEVLVFRPKKGKWKRLNFSFSICNHDETPQFVNYGVDSTPSGLIYAGKGEGCQKIIWENRECVTVHPFVSFNGDVARSVISYSKERGYRSKWLHQKQWWTSPTCWFR